MSQPPTRCGFSTLMATFFKGNGFGLDLGNDTCLGESNKRAALAHVIDHKTISRKHFVIEVAPVKAGAGSQALVRSKVTVTDEGSKGGTLIDGDPLKGTSRELKGIDHTIKPGKYPHDLRIKWHQACLSFSFSTKELKGDPLASRRDRLEELDIKTIIDYVVGETTHVVTNKRNTAKGLQALINAKHIVTNSYVDALVYAGTSEDLAEPENLSPMEKDFDAAWPDPLKHLPPIGKEIIQEPAASSATVFAPNLDRQEIFDGFTFVFCSTDQYENLLPMITTGHGKALLKPVENGKTSAAELVHYMTNAAGRKGFGDDDTQQKGGVVMVRWIAKGAMQQWADGLADEVARQIDQSPVEQGDFLNIILNNNPKLLRKSCAVASTVGDSMAPPPMSSFHTVKHPQSSPLRQSQVRQSIPPTESEQPPPKRQRTRGIIGSRFKAFDDGFDMEIDSIPPYLDDGSQFQANESVALSQIDDEYDDGPRASSINPSQVDEGARSNSEGPVIDDLLPAVAAMKKRRAEMEQKGTKKGRGQEGIKVEPARKVKRADKEIDVREAARKRLEAEEEAIRNDQEALEIAGIDVSKIQDLAIVVEMELPPRSKKPTRLNGQASDRWDEKWNGRKNFKRFRRQGNGDQRTRHVQNVIVPLEEAKKASYGLGDEYWLGNGRSSRTNTEQSISRVSQSQNQNTATPKSQPSAQHTSPSTTRLQDEASEIVGTIDLTESRATRASDKSRGKRPPVSQNMAPAKKQKTLKKSTAGDDSDDELKFRFGRRKK